MTGRLFGPVMGVRASSVFFQEHNVILSNLGTESGADNLAIACLRFHSLSCIVTLIVFTTDTTARHALPEHRTCNLTIIIRRSIRLSPRRRLSLHNKMFLVSVWHIQALSNV